jgi:hypothetical protein
VHIFRPGENGRFSSDSCCRITVSATLLPIVRLQACSSPARHRSIRELDRSDSDPGRSLSSGARPRQSSATGRHDLIKYRSFDRTRCIEADKGDYHVLTDDAFGCVRLTHRAVRQQDPCVAGPRPGCLRPRTGKADSAIIYMQPHSHAEGPLSTQ